MSTTIHPELSERSPYHIEKHRYYELKHFCLQYPMWKQAYRSISLLSAADASRSQIRLGSSDPTFNAAERLAYFSDRIDMVDACIRKTGCGMEAYILRGVTEGISFDRLNAANPCLFTREQYYDAYRKFFWELHKARR